MRKYYAMILIVALTVAAAPAGRAAEVDRTVLPIQEPKRPFYTELDARQVKPPAPFKVQAPAGAPNVVIVLIDDLGFAGPSTFGGPINTPILDGLAQNGLRYNNFHTTRLVFAHPGRPQVRPQPSHGKYGVHHRDGHLFPGCHGAVPNATAPLAEMLRLNGYSTGAFGKWHETAAWEVSVSALRPLADAPGLRQILRLHRRRNEPVGPVPVRRRYPGRTAGESKLPLHDRHDGQGAGLDQVPEGPDARQAGLRLFRTRGHPRPPSRAQRMDRPLEGEI